MSYFKPLSGITSSGRPVFTTQGEQSSPSFVQPGPPAHSHQSSTTLADIYLSPCLYSPCSTLTAGGLRLHLCHFGILATRIMPSADGPWNTHFHWGGGLAQWLRCHLSSCTHQQKQAEPQEQDNLPKDSWPVGPLQGPGDLGDASLDEIPGSCGDKGPFPKALAPWREGADVLGRKKPVQPWSHCLPEPGQGTEWETRPVDTNQIVQIFAHTWIPGK